MNFIFFLKKRLAKGLVIQFDLLIYLEMWSLIQIKYLRGKIPFKEAASYAATPEENEKTKNIKIEIKYSV